MGYSWISTNIGEETLEIIWQEIQDNLDLLYVDLELSPPSWTYTPVVGGDNTSLLTKELKTKTDTGDDENYCRTHNSALNTSERTTHFVTHDNIKDVSDLSAHLSNYDNQEDGAYLSNHNDTHLNNHNTTVNSDEYNSELGAEKSDQFGAVHDSYCDNVRGSDVGYARSGYESGYDATI